MMLHLDLTANALYEEFRLRIDLTSQDKLRGSEMLLLYRWGSNRRGS